MDHKPQSPKKRPYGRLVVALFALSLIASACGGGDSTTEEPDTADTPAAAAGSEADGDAADATDTEAAATEAAETEAEGGSEPATEGGGDADGVAQAQELLDEYLQPPSWQGPDASVDPSSSEGKSVWYISFADAIPVLKYWSDNTKQVIEEFGGAEFTLFDANGQVSEATRGIDQAIAAGADLIVTQALAPDLFAEAFKRADDEGIAIITGNSGTPGVVDANQWAEVTFDYPLIGELIGAWFITDSGGEGKGLLISSDDVPASDNQWEATLAKVDEWCPSCDLEVEDVQIASWESRLPTLTSTTINSEPDRNYFMPLYDGMTLPMVGGVRQTGAEDSVRIGAFNATPGIVENLADPGHPLRLDVGASNLWWAYAASDAVFRYFDGQEAIDNYNIGIRVFTEDSVADIDLTEDETAWYGGTPFIDEFKTLWGAS